MSYPRENFAIRSPQQLTSLLRRIKQSLSDGSLCQYRVDDTALATADLSLVSDEGPWPDYLEAFFANSETGERYKLTVETYHGAGGSWERL
jgi:hypothetical protein